MVLIHRQNAIREFIDGEAHVKGFLLAYLGLTQGYILLPEYESSKGYADFYMMPDLVRQPDIVYSYIVEAEKRGRSRMQADLVVHDCLFHIHSVFPPRCIRILRTIEYQIYPKPSMTKYTN